MKNFVISICLLWSLGTLAQVGKIEIEEVVYIGKDTLSGTLLTDFPIDSKNIKKSPIAIIIPGSGPTDRNGNSAMLPGPNDSYKLLADSLLSYGISSFRYDKLGIGNSTMHTEEQNLLFTSNITMVEGIFARLADIGFRKIYLVGHSEGALIASVAAQSLEVKGVATIAGPGRTFRDILEEQLSKQLSADIMRSTMHKLDSIAMGYKVENNNVMLASLLRESIQPYLRELLTLNPATELAKNDIPILVIQGGMDLQITEQDYNLLIQSAPKATAHLYPKMNHVLKDVQNMTENQASYTDPDFPLSSELALDLAKWIRANP